MSISSLLSPDDSANHGRHSAPMESLIEEGNHKHIITENFHPMGYHSIQHSIDHYKQQEHIPGHSQLDRYHAGSIHTLHGSLNQLHNTSKTSIMDNMSLPSSCAQASHSVQAVSEPSLRASSLDSTKNLNVQNHW